jgi:integrase
MTSLKIDKVNIEITKGKIRLRWTYQGQRFSLSMGNDNPQNLDLAKSKAYQINSDIYKGSFDYENHKPKPKIKVEPVVKEITLLELWDLFLKMKLKSGLKAKSIEWYENIDKLVKKLGEALTFNAFEVQENLSSITTNYRTVKALKALSACCEYGIERKLIKENNFKGVWKYLPSQQFNLPYCFGDAEIKKILNNFAAHETHQYYYELIIFWLNTGCRPSEALGIRWSDVNDDFSYLTFRGSPQRVKGGIIWSDGSKNFKKGGHSPKTRSMPINSNLKQMLTERYTTVKPVSSELIFPSKSGDYINYNGFCYYDWRKCVKTIEGLENATPYNFRDTFITKQLCKGVPIAVIAAWCDNSPAIIQSRYADYVRLAISKIIPENL